MSITTFLRKIFSGDTDLSQAPLVIDVKAEGTLSECVASDVARTTASLTLRGTIDGDDFTFLHKSFKSLTELDLSGAVIRSGRFVCGMHKNYYDLNDGELSAHTLHIGNLREVVLPESIKNIVLSGYSALNFGTCSDSSEFTRLSGAFAFDLETIVVPDGNKYYSSYDGILYNKEKTELLKCPASHSGELNFPTTLRKISPNAFRECKNLTKVELPNGVAEVGDCAFFGCSSLKELVLPATIEKLGDNVFAHSFNLERLECGSSVPPEMELTRRTNMSNCKLVVPTGAVKKYSIAPYWADFKKISDN